MPDEEKPFFHLREDGSGQEMLKAEGYVDALALAKRTGELLRAKFGSKDATVLLVGHGNASMALVRQLTGDPAFAGKHLDNTNYWVAKEQPDGTFKLETYNKGSKFLAPDNG